MTSNQVVIAAAVAQIIATALIALGVYSRMVDRWARIETKVEAMWWWFCERSKSPQLRKGDSS